MPHAIRQGDFLVVNYPDSGYWQVPIHPDHQKFLGVHYVHSDDSISYFVCQVMCLGLRDAAYIFTKLFKMAKTDKLT